MRAGRDAALRHDDAVAGGRSHELEGRAAVDRECVQVAGIDADHLGIELDRTGQLVGVVRLDERIQSQLGRARVHRSRAAVVELAQQQEHCIGSRLSQLLQLGLLAEEALGQ